MLLVLWDVDGTLVDTAGHGRHAFAEAFEAVLGRPPEWGVPFAGRTDHEIALALLERNGVERPESHLPRLRRALAGALAARAPAMRAEGRAQPGAREALLALGGREDVVQTLLTGNIAANAKLKLAAFGLELLVDLEVGGYGSDPHAARSDLVDVARERAAAKYSRPVTATALVGDTPLDVAAARGGGARAVGVATGPFGADELRAAGAATVLPDLTDTAAVLAAVGAS